MSSQLNIKKIAGLTSGAGNDTVTIETGGTGRVVVTNTAVTLDSSATLTANNISVKRGSETVFSATPTEVSLGGGQFGGRRNIAFNGAMQVQQRFANTNDATGVVSSASYALMDRWTQDLANTSFTLTANTNSGAQQYAFRKHLRIDVNAANTATHGQADHFILNQRYEGQDLQGFRKGTADAKPMALQFWVRSNVTGTFTVEANDQDNTRHNVISYTVDSADTWEQKKVVFAADTTGVLDNDNAHSFRLMWHLVPLGSTLDATFASNTWSTTRKLPTNHVVLDSSASNYFEITGVQFEIGNVHTPFEHVSYGEELARCQRYFQRIVADASYTAFAAGLCTTTTQMICALKYTTSMRASPTLAQNNTGINIQSQLATTSLGASYLGKDSAFVPVNVASGLTAGNAGLWNANNNADAYIDLAAEL